MTTATRTPASVPAPTLPSTMRALVKARAGDGLDYTKTRPLPTGSTGAAGEPGPNEVLIRVTHAGICGTDRHIWEWDEWAAGRIPVGIVTGHEFVGRIEKLGAAVQGLSIGQRVSAEGHVTAGLDYNSRTGAAHIARDTKIIGVDRDGCFAEFLMMPAYNVWPVAQAIPDAHAAILDPLGNAVHTVMEADVSTRSVVITGVGIIGLMAVTVARAAGAGRIFAVDIDPRRLALARKLGADEAFDGRQGDGWVAEVAKATRGEGADCLLEMSGASSAIDAGFRSLRNGGTAALLGIPGRPITFDLTKHVIFKGARVLGINGRKMFQTWYQMEDLLLSGRVRLDEIITHQIALEDYAKGFKAMQTGEAIKVVMKIA